MASDNSILIVAEVGGGTVRPASLELITAGKRLAADLGGDVVALLVGSGVADAAERLSTTGVDRLIVVEDPRLEHLSVDALTAVVSQVITDLTPAVVLIPATTAGIEVAPRVAARLGVGLAADAIGFSVEDGALIAIRPILGGRVQTAVKFGPARPQVATVRSGSFEQAPASDASIAAESFSPNLTEADLKVQVIGVSAKEQSGGVPLEEADVIVGGGRGLKEQANFALVEQLATALGGAVAATRAVTDAGWRPHHEQIGQTGRTIAPRLYIAVGISGAVQHLVGVQGSDYIVAINRDPDAPIFKVASFGIVGDLFEVVPAIINELQS